MHENCQTCPAQMEFHKVEPFIAQHETENLRNSEASFIEFLWREDHTNREECRYQSAGAKLGCGESKLHLQLKEKS